MLQRNHSCSGIRGAETRSAALLIPLPEPSQGCQRGSGQAEVMSPPHWGDLEHTDTARPCRAGGCSQGCTHSPCAEGSAAADMQRSGPFPGPDNLIPAIIAATGKGSFLGSCEMTEIYREEPGGKTTPWPRRARHSLGVGWVHLSHSSSFTALLLPKGARRGR